MKKLISLCGLINEETHEQIKDICLRHNFDLKLSKRFIDFNLHVSLKRTFYSEDFEDVKDDLYKLLISAKPIYCGKSKLIRNSDMLWLILSKNEKLIELHNKIDILLQKKYQIPIDTFDRFYIPHITIFRDNDKGDLDLMHKRLKDLLDDKEIMIDRYYIGSDHHGYFFF